MKNISIALIYIAFFGLIGGACYLTSSALPLWALLLMPSVNTKSNSSEDEDE
jgi:hypothetical protein